MMVITAILTSFQIAVMSEELNIDLAMVQSQTAEDITINDYGSSSCEIQTVLHIRDTRKIGQQSLWEFSAP